MTLISLAPLFPEIFLAIMGMLLLIVGVSSKGNATACVAWGCVINYIVAAGILVTMSWGDAIALNGMFTFDNFAGFMKLAILVGSIFSTILSIKYLEEEGIGRFEYPLLMLFAGIGMLLMVSASN